MDEELPVEGLDMRDLEAACLQSRHENARLRERLLAMEGAWEDATESLSRKEQMLQGLQVRKGSDGGVERGQ